MAKVNFIRKHTKAEVNDEPIVDGNFIVTGEGNVFIDYGEERIEIISSGGSITGDTLPIGSITAYGNETAPANWLICDGSAVSRTAYADLFAVIGTKYGEGDGSTTFNLPNLKGRVPVGLDSDDTDFNSIGKTGGEKTHKLTIEELAEHEHDIHGNTNTYSEPSVNYYQNSSIFSGYASGEQKILFYNGFEAEKTGGDQPHNNLQPYEINNFIIKAFQSAGVIAEVVNAQTESDTNTYSCNYINLLEPAYCKMNVYGNETYDNTGKIITSFTAPMSFGGFVANANQGYLFIPKGTKAIELSGMICGHGYVNCNMIIQDKDGVAISSYDKQFSGVLMQPAGTEYIKIPFANPIVQLDETKDWYIYLYISGYSKEFRVNDGFGTSASWIAAKKIR